VDKFGNARDFDTLPQDKNFVFNLFTADSSFNETAQAPVGTTNNSQGKFSFTLDIRQPGTYYYVLRELVDNVPTISYDGSRYNVMVVASDKGDGTMAVAVHTTDANGNPVNKDSHNFRNIYFPQSASVEVPITKILSNAAGGNVTAGGFEFGIFTDEKCTQPYTKDGQPSAVTSDETGGAIIRLRFTDQDAVQPEHVFYIKEVANAPIEGMEYDQTVYKLVVKLGYEGQVTQGNILTVEATAYDKDGNVVATKTKDQQALSESLEFTNIYELDPDSLVIAGNKNLIGKDITANDKFQFALYHATYENGVWTMGNQHGQPVTNDAKGNFAFPEIQYTTTGTHHYIVSEITPPADTANMAYDRTLRYITVSVTDGGNGQLKASVVSVVDSATDTAVADNKITFTNTFTPSPVSVNISGKKILTGRDWNERDVFTFDLYETGADYLVGDRQPVDTQTVSSATAKQADGSKLYVFDAIQFTADDVKDGKATRYFVTKEQNSGDPTITHSNDRNVKVEAQLNLQTGEIEVKIYTWFESGYVEMENFYNTKQTSAQVAVQKIISNDTGIHLGLKDYQIGVYTDANCTEESRIATLTTGDSGYASHSFTFTDADFNPAADNASEKAITYYLKEIVPAQPMAGMTYDEKVYTYTVTLSYDTHKNLVAVSQLKDSAGANVTTADFTNIYHLNAVEAEITGVKDLKLENGGSIWANDVHKNKEFVIQLYKTNSTMNYATAGAPIAEYTVTSTDRGYEFTNSTLKTDFADSLKFTKAGDYYFAVREKYSGSDADSSKYPNVRYDGKEYGVKFTVGLDENNPAQLKVIKTQYFLNAENYTGTLDFENLYTITGSTTVEFKGDKSLSGRALKENEFIFQLFEADENWTAETVAERTVYNKADGSFTFGSINYNQAGTYRYVIKEAVTNNPTITYDETVYRVTVTVSDNGDGTWTNSVVTVNTKTNATKTTKGTTEGVVFNNNYTSMNISTAVNIDKVLINNTGVTMDESGFEFQLYTDENCTTAVSGTTAVTNAQGKAAISLSFSDTDLLAGAEKVYYLKETKGIRAGMTYSTQVYKVTVKLEYIKENGSTVLKATPVITPLGESGAVAVASFTNTYSLTSTSISIPVQKTFSGAPSDLADREFSFKLYASPTRNYADGKQIGTATLKDGQSHTFAGLSELQFTKVGTYYFIAVEENGGHTQSNISHDGTQYVVKVVVSDNGDGTLAKAVTYGTYISGTESENFTAETVLNFTNTYIPQGDLTIALKGDKTLKDANGNERAVKEGEFDFLLYKADANFNVIGSPIGHVTNDANGNFSFENISVNKGEHYFVVREFVGSDPTIKYCTTDDDYWISIKVTDTTGSAGLDVETHVRKPNSSANVTSVYDRDAKTVELSGLDFENRYNQPADTSITINIDKLIDDRANTGIGKDGFKFGLYTDAQGTTLVKESGATDENGETSISMTFTASDYDAGAVKTYYLKEMPSGIANMSDSNEAYKVVVTLSAVKDNGTVKLVANTAITSVLTGAAVTEPQFTNIFAPKYEDVTIPVEKILTGREWTDDDAFTAVLYSTGAVHNISTGKQIGTAVLNKDNGGKYTFTKDTVSELTLKTAGTHYFTVVEQGGGTTADGIRYDGKVYGVDITVALDKASGQLKVTDTHIHLPSARADSVVFENIYTVSGSTSAEIKGTKNLPEREIRANEFSFALYQTDSSFAVADGAVPYRTVHTTTAGGNTAQFTFGQIPYSQKGTYYYTVKEIPFGNPTITYDDSVYNVTVTVTDNGKGEWNTPTVTIEKAGSAVNDIVFNNKYDSKTAPATIPVVKQLTNNTGAEYSLAGFEFGLYTDEKCEHPYTKDGQSVTVTTGADGTAAFSLDYTDKDIAQGQLSLTETYYIKEIKGNVPGMSYDPSVYKVVVTVEFVRNNGVVNLVATPEITLVSSHALYAVNDSAVFHNIYSLREAYLDIPGFKVMPQRTILDSDYLFQLYSATVADNVWTQGSLVQEAANIYQSVAGSADYDKFIFTDVMFEKAGTYHFIAVEKNTNLNGVTYDDSQYRITVTVGPDGTTDQLAAQITAIDKVVYTGGQETVTAVDVTGEKPVVFNNIYEVNGTFDIQGTKVIENRQWQDTDEFTFLLYQADADFEYDATKQPLAAATSTDGTFTFKNVPISNTKADFGPQGYDGVLHHYVVVEQKGDDKTITYDDTVYRLTVATKDNLDGTLTAGKFENGTFVPGQYLIEKEVVDTILLIFKTVSTEKAEKMEFVNIYNTIPVDVAVNGAKALTGSQTGRQIKAGEFTFQLWTANVSNGRWHEDTLVADTVNNAPQSDGTANLIFDTANTNGGLTFHEEGEYLFILKEVGGTNPIVGYDGTEYNLKVVVSQQDDPATEDKIELGAKVMLVNENGTCVEITDTALQTNLLTFTNSYNDTAVSVNILKQIVQKGNLSHNAEGFTFIIEDESGRVITDTLISDAEGRTGYTFEYDEQDIGKEYTYKVYEKAGTDRNMQYDDTVYTVTVKLTAENGILTADVTVKADDTDYDALNLVFTNIYNGNTPYSPDTGDNTGAMGYLSLLVLAGALLVVLLVIRKKKEDKE